MKTRYLSLCGLFAALLAVCAWISIPLGSVTFTMQTFAVILALLLLGGKWGSLTVFVYLLLGAVGVPVFSGFQGGFGVLLGPTGGYLWGFLLTALTFWLLTAFFGEKLRLPAAIFGLILCYLCGALWMANISLQEWDAFKLLQLMILPYLIPDAVKLFLAVILSHRLQRFIHT